ncbi:MAG TPA: hypothetical protein ENI07_17715 [Desulfobacterales bacterium]|nr:hypothetical protein [Desulfobacterales bacterium]
MTVIDVGLVQMSELEIEIVKIELKFRKKGLTTNNFRIVLSRLLHAACLKTYKSQKGNVKLVRSSDEQTLFEEEKEEG